MLYKIFASAYAEVPVGETTAMILEPDDVTTVEETIKTIEKRAPPKPKLEEVEKAVREELEVKPERLPAAGRAHT